MTQSSDGHMTVEDVLRTVHARARPERDALEAGLEEHLRQCAACNKRVVRYQELMSRLYELSNSGQAAEKCLDPSVWGELAAGLVSQKDATRYLTHAAGCADCTEELLQALDAVGSNDPAPEELQQSLATGTAEWQRNFAAKLASSALSARPASLKTSAPTKPWRRLIFPVWAYGGMAALLAVAAGIGLYMRLRGSSSETLLQEAYAKQRTIEMRIPGAGYGPIRAQRADGRSEVSSPQELLEAEVLIKRGLDKKPDDADLLRQKAEADLLNWNYQPALETLNHAARVKPNSFELLVDTATAYFERGEATANPADYEAGLQSLGDAIHLKPDDPAALFNRAIVYERLYFYGRAVADWEEFLKVEKDPGWKREAEQHLKDIRERQNQQSLVHNPDQLAVAAFRADLSNPALADAEEYVEAAERHILSTPSIADVHGENYLAANALAEVLQVRHSDRFLKDLLPAAADPGLYGALQKLGQSSSANHTGSYEEAFALARESFALFGKANNDAGLLAAQFEESYALQFESKADACATLAGNAAALAREKHYALIDVQLLFEQAICSNMRGNVGRARELTQTALALAKSHSYMSFYLRGLTVLADLDDQEGDESGAWRALHEGLGLYWSRRLPALRAYSLYAVLDLLAERLGHDHVQFASAFESVNFGFHNPDRNVEASERVRLANAALRTGELKVAQAEFNRAAGIFAAAPQTDSVRWRQLEARIGLARVQMVQGTEIAQSAAALSALLPELDRLSNRYVEFEYYQTLAELKWRLQDTAGARQYLGDAIRLTETGLQSLATWKQRTAWMEQHRRSYLLMTQLLFRSGDEQSALSLWEHFRSASGRDAVKHAGGEPRFSTIARETLPEVRIVTYALGPQGLMIWVRSAKGTHAAYLGAPHDLRRTAENFVNECSRPDSDGANLQRDAQLLYQWLIGPIEQWLPAKGHLLIEPDGALSLVPFEALVDDKARYLADRFAITMATSVQAHIQTGSDDTLLKTARMLIVAAPAGLNAPMEPPPEALSEAMHVGEQFPNRVMLTGRDATVLAVQRELAKSVVFHFAGHGSTGRNGAAMILADGMLDIEQAKTFRSAHLNQLQLAVLSACDTARPSEMQESDSLVSEFLQAGTRNVVASRWSVDSAATASFMELFYEAVLSGRNVADSLQAAAHDFRGTTERAHPYYWAGFSAFGSA